jgi:hypothetical protein
MSILGPWLALRAGPAAATIGQLVRSKSPSKLFGNETGPRGVDVAVAFGVLTVRKEALRDHQMKIVFRARHRDVEQTAFFFQFGGGAGAEIRRYAAIDDLENVHRFPFLAFCGVDGRENEIVLIQQRNEAWSLVASGGSSVSSVIKRSRDGWQSARAVSGRRGESLHLRGCGRDAVRTKAGRAPGPMAILSIGDFRQPL